MLRSSHSVVLNPHRWMISGFALVMLVGAVLLSLPAASATGESIGVLDALFMSASAVCVTGLAVVDTGTAFTMFGQLVIMTLVQIGGLGFMTFGVWVAVVLGKRIGLKQRLLIQESTGAASIHGIVKLSLNILIIALLFEGIAAVVLTARWAGELGLARAAYYAVFHAVSAFNNAGFALWSDSLIGYAADPTVNIAITLLFITGGIGFTVILDVYQRRSWRALSLHTKIVLLTSLVLSLGGFLVILLLELFNPATQSLTWDERLWTAYFQGVTTRTAGFNTVDIADMMAASQFFMIILMFIGASSGSTGGGIKTNTLMILILATYATIRGRSEVHAFNRRIALDNILRALAVIVASLFIIITVALLLTITEHALQKDFLEILFETTSAYGTVGLSMGLTPELSPIGKVIIICTMFIGRLGPLTLAFALYQKKRSSAVGHAEEKILVG